MQEMRVDAFTDALAAKVSVPGGGGASALAGALGMALGELVGVFTVGKKKYADVEARMQMLMEEARSIRGTLLRAIQQDAEAFEPLSRAYGISRDDPTREPVMEACLHAAADVPMQILEASCRAVELLEMVGIEEPEKRYHQYPHAFSGGQRQRIVIAIALAADPRVLIADEPTTALDVTMQAQILDLIKDIQKRTDTSVIFITHDLGVVANVADRVAVMYAGRIIEVGLSDEVFYDPRHPYTWGLLASMPTLAAKDETLYAIPGTPPTLIDPAPGDAFAPRNPWALEADRLAEPPLFPVSETHAAATWLLDARAPHVEPPENIALRAQAFRKKQSERSAAL